MSYLMVLLIMNKSRCACKKYETEVTLYERTGWAVSQHNVKSKCINDAEWYVKNIKDPKYTELRRILNGKR
jgi:hypothetical protein